MSSQPGSRGGRNSRRSMFTRMLVRAMVLRRGRALTALLALTVATATATAMLNLYVDVQAKLRKEFRNYGANLVIVGKDGQSLPGETLSNVQKIVNGRGAAVPFAYVIARTRDGQPVVVAGTDFIAVQKLDSWWSVSAWPRAANEALVGVRAAQAISPKGEQFDLTFEGKTISVAPAGRLQTGAAEDSRIYLSSADFESWTGVRPSTIEVAISGSAEEIEQAIHRLEQSIPFAQVRPVRQIMEAEARVFGKMRATLLVAAILIVATAGLCVLATLTGLVFDRRRDFAIMKALGASGRMIHGFFAAEAASLGAVAALIGFLIGIAIAGAIGRINFQSPIEPRLGVLPIVILGSVASALMAAIWPMRLLQRIQPANILRGE
jgi:putative ABC transport system permease protein